MWGSSFDCVVWDRDVGRVKIKKLNASGIKCFRRMARVTRMYRMKNMNVRIRMGLIKCLSTRVDLRVHMCNKQMERMDERCFLLNVMNA